MATIATTFLLLNMWDEDEKREQELDKTDPRCSKCGHRNSWHSPNCNYVMGIFRHHKCECNSNKLGECSGDGNKN